MPQVLTQAWLVLLREGRDWPVGKVLAYVESCRQLWQIMDRDCDE